MLRRKFGGQTPSGSREKFILVLTSKGPNSMKNGSKLKFSTSKLTEIFGFGGVEQVFSGSNPSGSREMPILGTFAIITSNGHNFMKNGSTMPNLDRNGIIEVQIVRKEGNFSFNVIVYCCVIFVACEKPPSGWVVGVGVQRLC